MIVNVIKILKALNVAAELAESMGISWKDVGRRIAESPDGKIRLDDIHELMREAEDAIGSIKGTGE